MQGSPDSNGKTIVYFVTEDWYFCSHRLPLAIAAKNAGYAVYVVTRVSAHGAEIESAGLNLVPVTLSRRSKNPIVEAKFIWNLIRIYKNIRPDIVHHIALKPVVYGAIAARVAKVPLVVGAMAGLGFLFSSRTLIARTLRPAIRRLLGLLLNNDRTTVILQNPDDVKILCDTGTISRDRVRLIRGSGVDPAVYRREPELDGTPTVLLASRMLWDKGIAEFVEAAVRVKQVRANVKFVLAGDSDDENPASISVDQLREWHEQGSVEYWGRCSDMPGIFAKVHVVCLPTAYGEGVPKVLIEAASCGRPIVASDAPGCREIVVDGVNGTLIPVKNVDALVKAINELLDSPELRSRMGRAGRELVKAEFSVQKVVDETLAIYRRHD